MGLVELFLWIGIVLCTVAGWNRAPWPIPIAVGLGIGALLALSTYLTRPDLPTSKAIFFLILAPILTTGGYCIARGIRSIKDRATKSPKA